MVNLPVDPKTEPTPEQMMRAEIADIIFQAHGEANIAMGRAAIDVIDGAPIASTLDILSKKMEAICRMLKKAAYLKAGLTI